LVSQWPEVAHHWIQGTGVEDVKGIGGALKTGKVSHPLPLIGDLDTLWAKEGDLVFRLEGSGVLNPGLFVDQELNRQTLRSLLQELRLSGSALNLFSYTGAFSLLARSLGLRSVSVDLSKRYLEWEKENHLRNFGNLESAVFFRKDAREFLQKTKEKFSLIVLDPPSFSRANKGPMLVRRDLPMMLERCAHILEDKGIIFVSSNLRDWESDSFIEELARVKSIKRGGFKVRRGRVAQGYPSTHVLNSVFFYRG